MTQIRIFGLRQVGRFFGLGALRRLLRAESGVTAIEYGLLSALIGVVLISVLGLVGIELTRTFDTIADSFATTAGGTSNTDQGTPTTDQGSPEEHDENHRSRPGNKDRAREAQ